MWLALVKKHLHVLKKVNNLVSLNFEYLFDNDIVLITNKHW